MWNAFTRVTGLYRLFSFTPSDLDTAADQAEDQGITNDTQNPLYNK